MSFHPNAGSVLREMAFYIDGMRSRERTPEVMRELALYFDNKSREFTNIGNELREKEEMNGKGVGYYSPNTDITYHTSNRLKNKIDFLTFYTPDGPIKVKVLADKVDIVGGREQYNNFLKRSSAESKRVLAEGIKKITEELGGAFWDVGGYNGLKDLENETKEHLNYHNSLEKAKEKEELFARNPELRARYNSMKEQLLKIRGQKEFPQKNQAEMEQLFKRESIPGMSAEEAQRRKSQYITDQNLRKWNEGETRNISATDREDEKREALKRKQERIKRAFMGLQRRRIENRYSGQ